MPKSRSRFPRDEGSMPTQHKRLRVEPVAASRTPKRISRGRSVLGPEHDQYLGRFGLVRLQTGRVALAPVGQVHDLRRAPCPISGFRRLDDIEALAVEEERVLAEQLVQLRDHGMGVGNGLTFELRQSTFHLRRSEFHRTLLSIGLAPYDKRCAPPPAPKYGPHA